MTILNNALPSLVALAGALAILHLATRRRIQPKAVRARAGRR